MLQILKRISKIKVVFLAIGYFLALSPIWIVFLFLKPYYHEDSFGSGADGFIWFYYLMWAFLLYFILQIFVLFFQRGSLRAYFLTFLSPSVLVWFCSLLLMKYII